MHTLIRPKGNPLALAPPQLIRSVAVRAKLSDAEAGRALAALEELLLEEALGAVTRRLSAVIQGALGIDPSQMASTSGPDQRRAIAAASESTDAGPGRIKASSGGSHQRVAA